MKRSLAFVTAMTLSVLVGTAAIGCGNKTSTAEDQNTRVVVRIKDDLYRAQNGDAFTVFIITPEGTIVADPMSPSFAAWLQNELEESLYDEPVRYVVYTDHQSNRASGGKVFANTAKFVAHDNVPRALGVPGDVYPPTITYSDMYTITLGGKEVVLIHPRNAEDMTVLYFPAERTVFGANLLEVKRLPPDLPSNLGLWIDSLRQIERLDFDVIVPAHGMMGKKEDLTAYRQYLQDLAAGVADGIAKGKSARDLQASLTLDAYKQWDGYDTNRPRNIAQAFTMLAGSQ